VKSPKFSFAFPSVVTNRFLRRNKDAVASLDARSSFNFSGLSPIIQRKRVLTVPEDMLKVKSFCFYPTFALPSGLHGVNASFCDSNKPGDVTSVQAYSQYARHFKTPESRDFEKMEYLDLFQMRSKCSVKKANLLQLFTAMAKENSFGFRIEIGVCVSALDKEGIAEAVKKALYFYSESVVPFETAPMLKFSYTWAAFACNFEYLSINCLNDSLCDLSDRICHLTLSSCYADLLRQFSSGKTFSSCSSRLVLASRSLNFPLLPRPSKKISSLVQVTTDTLGAVEDTCNSSNNIFASVIFFFFIFLFVYFFFKIFFFFNEIFV